MRAKLIESEFYRDVGLSDEQERLLRSSENPVSKLSVLMRNIESNDTTDLSEVKQTLDLLRDDVILTVALNYLKKNLGIKFYKFSDDTIRANFKNGVIQITLGEGKMGFWIVTFDARGDFKTMNMSSAGTLAQVKNRVEKDIEKFKLV